jgi:hypothetical protein
MTRKQIKEAEVLHALGIHTWIEIPGLEGYKTLHRICSICHYIEFHGSEGWVESSHNYPGHSHRRDEISRLTGIKL